MNDCVNFALYILSEWRIALIRRWDYVRTDGEISACAVDNNCGGHENKTGISGTKPLLMKY
jgi:hypothetical protein